MKFRSFQGYWKVAWADFWSGLVLKSEIAHEHKDASLERSDFTLSLASMVDNAETLQLKFNVTIRLQFYIFLIIHTSRRIPKL